MTKPTTIPMPLGAPYNACVVHRGAWPDEPPPHECPSRAPAIAAPALGLCPVCEKDPPPLVAVLSDDGKAWDANGCMRCRSTWCHQVPRDLAAIPIDAARVSWLYVRGAAYIAEKPYRKHLAAHAPPRLLVDAEAECERLRAEVATLTAEREEARDWVRPTTQMSRVLTCAFCGEAYPPGTPDSNHVSLTAHVMVCAKHPMRAVEVELGRARLERDEAIVDRDDAYAGLDAALALAGVPSLASASAASPRSSSIAAVPSAEVLAEIRTFYAEMNRAAVDGEARMKVIRALAFAALKIAGCVK